MSTNEIKLEIFRLVDALDANKLKEFYGVMQNYINSKREVEDWNDITETEKHGIEDAINELNAGKGLPHDQVMNGFRKKHSHA